MCIVLLLEIFDQNTFTNCVQEDLERGDNNDIHLTMDIFSPAMTDQDCERLIEYSLQSALAHDYTL